MRKYKAKQAVSLILAAALLAGSLSACGKEGDSVSVANQTENKQAAEPDLENACRITLSEDSAKITGNGAEEKDGVITITEKGTYIVTGILKEGRLIVNAPKQEVTLMLEEADITCSYGSPLYIYKSSLTTVYLAEGTENLLTDGSSYTFDDSLSSQTDDEPNACLYSKSDLIVAGSGSLTVNANYNNGITGKDTLNIESASIVVTAVNQGIKGKDSCTVKDADISITCGKDGIHTEGDLLVSGGSYQLSVGDDGMHADKNVKVTDGTIQIEKCCEGIEGENIDISGGTIEITASDDGINAASDAGTDYYINISGGKITVDASGDGIDSNGSLTVSGGELYVSGPENNGNSALDCDGAAIITGGIVAAAGYSGMAQNFGEGSTQGSILLNLDSVSKEKISVSDSSGNVLLEYSPAKNYNCIVVSCPSLEKGSTYTVNAGGNETEITLDELIYGKSFGMNGGGQKPDGENGGRPEGIEPPNGERPEGMEPPNGEKPEGMEPPNGERPEGMELPNGESL